MSGIREIKQERWTLLPGRAANHDVNTIKNTYSRAQDEGQIWNRAITTFSIQIFTVSFFVIFFVHSLAEINLNTEFKPCLVGKLEARPNKRTLP